MVNLHRSDDSEHLSIESDVQNEAGDYTPSTISNVAIEVPLHHSSQQQGATNAQPTSSGTLPTTENALSLAVQVGSEPSARTSTAVAAQYFVRFAGELHIFIYALLDL